MVENIVGLFSVVVSEISDIPISDTLQGYLSNLRTYKNPLIMNATQEKV